jgi:hypothetical protein
VQKWNNIIFIIVDIPVSYKNSKEFKMPEVVEDKWTICLQTVEVRSEKQTKLLKFLFPQQYFT